MSRARPSIVRDILPASLPPRGLSRVEAAAYIGISANKFDELVEQNQMPQPKCIGRRKVWDRFMLDVAFAELPSEHEGANPWD